MNHADTLQSSNTLFTILGGTTIPDRAAIVRAECREGSRVLLRTAPVQTGSRTQIDVWLECRSLLGLAKTWKKIGHVPDDVAAALLAVDPEVSSVVAHGTVKAIYAPTGRDEAAVTVEITPAHSPETA